MLTIKPHLNSEMFDRPQSHGLLQLLILNSCFSIDRNAMAFRFRLLMGGVKQIYDRIGLLENRSQADKNIRKAE